MHKLSSIALVIGLGATLAGCQDMSKQQAGTLAGVAAGGLIGSQFGGGTGKIAASIGGAMAGAAIGGMIGKNMDRTDRLEMQQALEKQKTGQAKQWQNPDTGQPYKVVPKKTYHSDQGNPCREYYMETKIGSEVKEVWGRACRQSDGSWRIVN